MLRDVRLVRSTSQNNYILQNIRFSKFLNSKLSNDKVLIPLQSMILKTF